MYGLHVDIRKAHMIYVEATINDFENLLYMGIYVDICDKENASSFQSRVDILSQCDRILTSFWK